MTGKELDSIIGNAGIRIVEAAHLFHISRSTLYSWLDEVPPKSQYLWSSAVKMANLIQAATVKGYLPVKDVTGADRLFAIKTALRTTAALQLDK